MNEVHHLCSRCGEPTTAKGNYCPPCARSVVDEIWVELGEEPPKHMEGTR